MLGSDIDICGTDMNPVFQTQRVGIESFKADVPDGEYSVSLYWAELDSDKKKEALIYNWEQTRNRRLLETVVSESQSTE